MSTAKDTGGPAFPRPVAIAQTSKGDIVVEGEGGMTLRDHFAGLALQGYMASFPSIAEPAEFKTTIARDAYLIADAMIEARKS